MGDPEPWTPEERFSRDVYLVDEFSEASCLTALRDMIESDRAEIRRLTEMVNQADRTFGEFVNITGGDFRNIAEQLDAIRDRLAALESPTDPDTVTVPRSLMNVFGDWSNGQASLATLRRAYDAWKAGRQG